MRVLRLHITFYFLILSTSIDATAWTAAELPFPVQVDDAPSLMRQILLPLNRRLRSLYYNSRMRSTERDDHEIALIIDDYQNCDSAEYSIASHTTQLSNGWGQTLEFHPCGRQRSFIEIIRTGQDVKPLSMQQILTAQIPAPAINQNLKITISWLPNFLIEIRNQNNDVNGVFRVVFANTTHLQVNFANYFTHLTSPGAVVEVRRYEYIFIDHSSKSTGGILEAQKVIYDDRVLPDFSYFFDQKPINAKDFSRGYQDGTINGLVENLSLFLTFLPGNPPNHTSLPTQ